MAFPFLILILLSSKAGHASAAQKLTLCLNTYGDLAERAGSSPSLPEKEPNGFAELRTQPEIAAMPLSDGFWPALEKELARSPIDKFSLKQAIIMESLNHNTGTLLKELQIEKLTENLLGWYTRNAPSRLKSGPPPKLSLYLGDAAEKAPETLRVAAKGFSPKVEVKPVGATSALPAEARRQEGKSSPIQNVLQFAGERGRPVNYLLVELENNRMILAFTLYSAGAGHEGMAELVKQTYGSAIRKIHGVGEVRPVRQNGSYRIQGLNETSGWGVHAKQAGINHNDAIKALALIRKYAPYLVAPDAQGVHFDKDKPETQHWDVRLRNYISTAEGDPFLHRIGNDFGSILLALRAKTPEKIERKHPENLRVFVELLREDGFPNQELLREAKSYLQQIEAGTFPPSDLSKAEATLRKLRNEYEERRRDPGLTTTLLELRVPAGAPVPSQGARR